MAEQQILIPEVLDAEFAEETAIAPNGGKGRPKGTRSRRHRFLEALASDHVVSIIETVVRAAQSGDMYAAKLILDRLWPRPRNAAITTELLPEQCQQPNVSDLRGAMMKAFAQVQAGEIPAEDGAALVSMIRDMIAAHSIQTVSPAAAIELEAEDSRQTLFDRLKRIADKQRELEPPEGPVQ